MNETVVGRVLFPLHERLKGKPTFRWLAELERTQWLAPEQLAAYQFARLQALLTWAHERAPYYRELLEAAGLPEGKLSSPDDLRRVPFLTRDLLRARFDDLRARADLRGVQLRSSGGSTGQPVTVLVDMTRMGVEEAARLRAHRWFGLAPGAREVVLWGSPIELGRQDRIRQLRDQLLNSRLLSAFDLGDAQLARYVYEVAGFRPAKMYGYASALHLLAVAWARTGRRPPAGLRAVFTTAEPLFDWQKKAIESAFGCPAAVEYGCRDGGLAALECPEGGLHIAAEHMVVEIADPDAEGRGEIVLTNLDSRALPTIRYRTGDIGSLDGTPCPCGRGLPRLGAVEGRRTDFLVTPRGRVLHALSVIYPLREMTAIREFRVVQESIDRVVVRVVPERPLGAVGRADLARPLEALLGPDVRVEVEEVAAIPRTASGKFRYVESRITGDHQIPLTHPGRVPTARVSRSHDR